MLVLRRSRSTSSLVLGARSCQAAAGTSSRDGSFGRDWWWHGNLVLLDLLSPNGGDFDFLLLSPRFYASRSLLFLFLEETCSSARSVDSCRKLACSDSRADVIIDFPAFF